LTELVVEIAKGPGLSRAHLHTGRYDLHSNIFFLFDPPVDTVKAKGAFFHHTSCSMRKRPGTPAFPIRRGVMAMISLLNLVFVIETPGIIRTCHHTVTAPYAPPKVLHNYSIGSTISGFYRTNSNARGLFAVHAGHRNEFNTAIWIATATHGDDFVPINFPSPPLIFRRTVGNVILLPASHCTGLAAYALV